MLSLTFDSDRKRDSKQYFHIYSTNSKKCTPNVYTTTWAHNTTIIAVPWFRCHWWGKLQYQIQTIDLQFQTEGRAVSIFTQSSMHISLHISKPVVDGDKRVYTHSTLSAYLHMHMQSHTWVSEATPCSCSGNGSSCCPWLKINMCARASVWSA